MRLQFLNFLLFTFAFCLAASAGFTGPGAVGHVASLSRRAVAPPAAPVIAMRDDNNNDNTGAPRLTIEWPEVIEATSYKIYRAPTSGGSFSLIASGVVDFFYTDTGMDYCDSFFYKVKAVGPGGDSSFSNEEEGQSVGPERNDLAAAWNGVDGIELTWGGNPACNVITSVRRSVELGGPYVEIGTAGATDTTFTDTGGSPGLTYYYVIIFNIGAPSGGQSNFSNEASDSFP